MTTSPDALEAELATQVRTAVMRLRRRLINERHPDNELSLGAMAVLVALQINGEMTLGELAARERVQPPSMTRTVNALEEGGYVLRRAGDVDRRQVIVTVTERGKRVVTEDRARRDAWLTLRLDELTPEERDVVLRASQILERLATS